MGEEDTKAQGSLEETLRTFRDWHQAIVFDHEAKLLAATCEVDLKEIKCLLLVFDDRDTTVGQGVVLHRRHYEVQRFHGDLIYGRLASAREKEGFCLCRVTNKHTQKPIYTLITYLAPVVSARAIPQLRDFARKHLTELSV